jgi:hypothetical protein
MLLKGVPRAAARVVRSVGYWVGSVVGGGGGAFLGSWAITRRFLASYFLAFEVFECRTIFFVIFCTFSQNFIALGGVVVVLWSSGGGCHVGCGRAQKLRHAQKPHRARYVACPLMTTARSISYPRYFIIM